METEARIDVADSGDPLGPFRNEPIHIWVMPQMLREQLRLIFTTLKFTNLTVHPVNPVYVASIKELASLLLRNKGGLFFIQPPLEVYDQTSKVKMAKDWAEFFASVGPLVSRSRTELMHTLARCVPVFEDIEFIHKREKVILSLAEYGVNGVFILKKQDPLTQGMHPRKRREAMQRQVLERFRELRDYLMDFLPHRSSSLDTLMGKWEERKLVERKVEAEKWMQQASEFKEANELEKSIQCYKKAIELYPADPRAYLESGRVYMRTRKYPHALERFRQAEEVAETLPEPNKEIACVRILQVQDRLARGESPSSPEVAALMAEAVANFGKALVKAEDVDRPDAAPGASREKNINAVMRIAGEILKLDLPAVLGNEHPAVKKLSSMARDSLLMIKGKPLSELSGQQIIFMAEAALHAGDFERAEKLLYKAMEDQDARDEACKEIIYLGQYTRRHSGPREAIGIYQRLLGHSPPNRAAIYFNMAVAFSENEDAAQAGGAIARALFIDPDLPLDRNFYRNPTLTPVLRRLLQLFSPFANPAAPQGGSDEQIQALTRQESLDVLLLAKDKAKAMQLLMQTAGKTPAFFQQHAVLADTVIMNFLPPVIGVLKAANKPEMTKLAGFLEQVLQRRDNTEIATEAVGFQQSALEILRVLSSPEPHDEAASRMAMLAWRFTDYVASPAFLGHPRLVALCTRVLQSLNNVNTGKLKAIK